MTKDVDGEERDLDDCNAELLDEAEEEDPDTDLEEFFSRVPDRP